MTVINVVLFGNLVQSIDAGISTFETVGQMSTRSHVLIARPMKFNAGFSQPFLMFTPHPFWVIVLLVPFLLLGAGFFLERVFIFSHHRNPIDVSTFSLVPNLPTRARVSTVSLVEQDLCLCLYPQDSRLTFFQRSCDVLEWLLNEY